MRDLVVQAQDADRDAFAALVDLTGDRLYAVAARILRDHETVRFVDALPTPPPS